MRRDYYRDRDMSPFEEEYLKMHRRASRQGWIAIVIVAIVLFVLISSGVFSGVFYGY